MTTKKLIHSIKHNDQPKAQISKHGVIFFPKKSNLNIKDARGLLKGIDTTVSRDKS